MPANGPNIIKRYNSLKEERAIFDAKWERMAPYIAPSREGIRNQFLPGVKQGRNVYDSTTMLAAELMAMFMAGNTINPAQRWFGLKMAEEEIGRLDPVKEWLEESRNRMLEKFAASQFYAEAPESMIDYGGFGTSSLLIEELPQPINEVKEGFRGFMFHSDKIGRFIIAEGADGLVDTEMREFRLTARTAKDRWGEDSLSPKMKKVLADGKPDELFTVVHDIEPRPSAERKAGNLGMPWMSAWIEKEEKHVLFESGYEMFPAAVPRYSKTPGEVYGRGRGDLAFADTWTLNTAKRMGLEDWALKIRPPIVTRHDSVFGTLRFKPAGIMSVNTHGQPIRDVIAPFETGSRPEVSQIKEEELRKSINRIFFVDQILAMLEVHKSEMTAEEFRGKMVLLFRLLGPVYGRLEREWLRIIIDVSFQTMLIAGEFSPPPAEMLDSSGDIDVDFQNPIADAQRVADVDAITLAFNDLTPMAQVFPDVFDRFDPDKTSAEVFDIRGVPAKVTRSDDEMAAVREARAEQARNELALEDAKGVSEALKNAAPMVKALQGQQGQGAA